MFHGLRAGGFDVCDQEILMPEPGETLPELAGRIAEQIADRVNDEFVLGGASFGGMLASEMCSILRPRGLLQLGSCLTGEALGPLPRYVCGLLQRVPGPLMKAPPWRVVTIRYHLGPMSSTVYTIGRDMWNKTDIDLIRRGARMILTWPGPERIPCSVYRVHGTKDRLVRWMDGPATIEGAYKTLLVEGAGHLVSMTHEAVVNRFVAEMLNELNGSP